MAIITVFATWMASSAALDKSFSPESRVAPELTLSSVPVPDEWRYLRPARAGDNARLHIVLCRRPGTLQLLESELLAVSTPGSVRYGQHLTRAEVNQLARPVHGAQETILQWLRSEQLSIIPSVSASDAIITITVNAAEAKKLFRCDLAVYIHRDLEESGSISRCLGRNYSVPVAMANVIEIIEGLANFPSLKMPHSNHLIKYDAGTPPEKDMGVWPTDCSKCNEGVKLGNRITPAVLNQTYNLGNRPPSKSKGSIAVAEFQQVYWDQRDLSTFGSYCGIGNITVDHMIGSNNQKRCEVPGIMRPNLCKEALLDIQTAKGLLGTIPLTNIYNDGYSLLGWAKQVGEMSDDEIPLVHSVSYGNDETQQISEGYMYAVNAELMKLGTRGLSILFASGDGGVVGRSGSSRRYHPGFPAASPFVTAVGGTNFLTRGVIGAESAWFGSGGGFSDTFGIPSWQASNVASYLKEASGQLPPASAWNSSGRGFPDVSALGGQLNQYCIVIDRQVTGAYGTSAATPVFASVVAKLNDLRLSAGKPPLGFLNPFLYQNTDAFQDVTHGRNSGSPATSAKGGFPALKGWDPATGLGTPNFAALAAAAMKYDI